MMHINKLTGKNKKGSILVTLLIFVAMGIIITSGAVTVSLINTQGSSQFSTGEGVLNLAEIGIEEALIRVLRDPSYTVSEEVLDLDGGTATINITGAAEKTIVSKGASSGFRRNIQVTGTINNYEFDLTNWSEID